MSAAVARLSATRLHLQHGPIDVIVDLDGAPADIEGAFAALTDYFPDVLPGLVSELPSLRTPLPSESAPKLHGPIARRMIEACWPFRGCWVTPMAAVAGAVADELLALIVRTSPSLRRAWVNDGGDIALHLASGERATLGIVDDPQRPTLNAKTTVRKEDGVGGVATSGWRGRSQSLGIADAVTVLAANAARADAAATLIANAVNAAHESIQRLPAHMVKDDSDLSAQLVTVAVGALDHETIVSALNNGIARAQAFCDDNLILAASLRVQGQARFVAAGNFHAANALLSSSAPALR